MAKQPAFIVADPAPPYEPTVTEQYPIAKWEVEGQSEAFPIIAIDEEGGNRIIRHERPYREGAKLDDTGAKAILWQLDAVFNNTIQEDGLGTDPLYPTVLNRLIRLFHIHATGNLTVPTRGVVRARAAHYRRRETSEEIDHAVVQFTWEEDNEDAIERGALKEPTARATLIRLVEQTRFDQESGGLMPFTTALQAAAEDLQDIMQAPGATVDEFVRAAERVKATAKRTIDVMHLESSRVGILAGDPAASDAERKLLRLIDLVSRAASERDSSRPRTRRFTVQQDSSIYAVAASLGQDADLLLDLNALADPLFIEAGTVIRVFAA